MKFFEFVRSMTILVFGVYCGSFVLENGTSTFEAIVTIGLFLILTQLEFSSD